MNEKEKYARDWDKSAEYFLRHKKYKQLSEQIYKFKTVLEIGCGTGQSTLALLESGHTVIAIDQNPYCIEKAKNLISKSNYSIKSSINDLTEKSVCFLKKMLPILCL